MPKFAVIHSSSRYNRSPRSLRDATERYMDYPDVSIITYTEINKESRENGIRYTSNRWHLISGDKSPRDDCGIFYDKTKWKLIGKETFRLGNRRHYKRGGRKTHYFYGQIACLKSQEDGHKIIVIASHMPSAIEGTLRKGRRSFRTRALRQYIRNIHDKGNRWRRRYKAKAVLHATDYNLNIEHKWVRRYIKAMTPMYWFSWKNFKGRGTHGGRKIDVIMIRGKIWMPKPSKLITDDNSSDHTPFITTFKTKG